MFYYKGDSLVSPFLLIWKRSRIWYIIKILFRMWKLPRYYVEETEYWNGEYDLLDLYDLLYWDALALLLWEITRTDWTEFPLIFSEDGSNENASNISIHIKWTKKKRFRNGGKLFLLFKWYKSTRIWVEIEAWLVFH